MNLFPSWLPSWICQFCKTAVQTVSMENENSLNENFIHSETVFAFLSWTGVGLLTWKISACYMGQKVPERWPQPDTRHCSRNSWDNFVSSFFPAQILQKGGVHLITITLPIVFQPSYSTILCLNPRHEASLPMLLGQQWWYYSLSCFSVTFPPTPRLFGSKPLCWQSVKGGFLGLGLSHSSRWRKPSVQQREAHQMSLLTRGRKLFEKSPTLSAKLLFPLHTAVMLPWCGCHVFWYSVSFSCVYCESKMEWCSCGWMCSMLVNLRNMGLVQFMEMNFSDASMQCSYDKMPQLEIQL